jgi:hypothetical protein
MRMQAGAKIRPSRKFRCRRLFEGFDCGGPSVRSTLAATQGCYTGLHRVYENSLILLGFPTFSASWRRGRDSPPVSEATRQSGAFGQPDRLLLTLEAEQIAARRRAAGERAWECLRRKIEPSGGAAAIIGRIRCRTTTLSANAKASRIRCSSFCQGIDLTVMSESSVVKTSPRYESATSFAVVALFLGPNQNKLRN